MSESWIVDIKRLMEFDRQKRTAADMSTNINQEFDRSIYKVPNKLKDANADAYRPKLFSLGPYHHCRPHLLPLDQHKDRACARFLQRLAESFAEAPEDVASAMRNIVDLLLNAYGEPEEEEINKEEFLRLMIVDGCFVLELLFWKEFDYGVMDPVFGKKGMELFFNGIRRDMLLLENQLPLLALHTLARFPRLEARTVNSSIAEFYGLPRIRNESKYLHILDLYRKNKIEHGKFCTGLYMPKLLPVTELSYAGISFRPSQTRSYKDISLVGRVLWLPWLGINDDTESLLLNLMCFERMHPAAGNEVIAYAFFMKNIIYTSEDVALLRKNGIIESGLEYDDKVVNMFKQIIKEQMILRTKEYSWDNDVSLRLMEHCESVLIKFRIKFMRKFWNDPISFSIFWLGIVVMLVLALIQTIYTVLSYKQAQHGR